MTDKEKNVGNEHWLYNYSTENYMDINTPEIKKAKKDLLKQSYTSTKRAFEIFFVTCVGVLLPVALYNLLVNVERANFHVLVVGALCGILFSDFMSGLVHWAADTWGTLDWPFVGPTFIRSFREHHVSPTAMCEHDFFETNGDNFMLVVIPLFLLSIKNYFENSPDGINVPWFEIFSSMFWLSTSIGVAMTNQFHKWSHTAKPPALVSFLQNSWIILPKSNHSLHHRPAFDGYYCITTGWLNPLLDGTNFWKKVEYLVNKATGLIPREDDWKWTGLVKDTPDVVKKFMEKNKEKQ
jgi:ubiquitin-conjugating enzyme E2 variant